MDGCLDRERALISDVSWAGLGLSCLFLIGMGASGLAAIRARRRQQKGDLRVQSVLNEYLAERRPEPTPLRTALKPHRSLILQAGIIFGFERSQLDHSPVAWWIVLALAMVLARIGASFVTDVFGPWGWASLPVIWIMLSRFHFDWSHRRHTSRLIEQFPDALAMIVRSLGVGVPLQEAISIVAREGVAPTSFEFARVADQLSIGVSLGQAVKSMGLRTGLSEYRFFATAVSLQALTGGGLSEPLGNLASLIRKRRAVSERANALSSEAQTSSWILGGLPIGIGTIIWLVNPHYMSLLFTDVLGREILGVAVLLLAFGALVMRIIIKRSLS